MDTTARAPFGVITNENAEHVPSFRPVASRMKERGWGETIVSSITLGLEVRCRIVPPGDFRAVSVTDFPAQFEQQMDEIISRINSRDIYMVFRGVAVRQRLPSVYAGDFDGLSMSQCRGFDRLWREMPEAYYSSSAVVDKVIAAGVRAEPYLNAFRRKGWNANTYVVFYTPEPSGKPKWFDDMQSRRDMKWDSTPW